LIQLIEYRLTGNQFTSLLTLIV